jgi:hypothetical protein
MLIRMLNESPRYGLPNHEVRSRLKVRTLGTVDAWRLMVTEHGRVARSTRSPWAPYRIQLWGPEEKDMRAASGGVMWAARQRG